MRPVEASKTASGSCDAIRVAEGGCDGLTPSGRPEAFPVLSAGATKEDNGKDAAEPLAYLLLVEDNEMVSALMVDVFEDAGYHVTATAQPSTALHMLGDGAHVDVLLTDLHLPEMNGLELISRALAQKPDLAVILATGGDVRRTDLPCNSVAVVTKPFLPQDLLEAIQSSLSLQRKATANGG